MNKYMMKKIYLFTLMLVFVLCGCGSSEINNGDTNVQTIPTQKQINDTNETIEEKSSVQAEYEKKLEDAKALIDKNIKEAYDEASDLVTLYPDSEEAKSLYETVKGKYIKSFTDKMSELKSSEKYLDAIKIYNAEKSILADDPTATSLFEEAREKYISSAIDESDAIFYTDGPDLAVVNLVKYRTQEITCTEIDDRIEVYKSYVPMKMTVMDPFVFEGSENYSYIWDETSQDNMGNAGFFGYKYSVLDTGFQDKNRYKYREWKYTYLLDGNYDYFDAIIADSYESKDYIDDKYDAYVEVYNGDILIFTSDKVRGGITPKEIHAEITNAEQVTIVVKGRAFNCGGSKSFKVGLLNPVFGKNIPDSLD